MTRGSQEVVHPQRHYLLNWMTRTNSQWLVGFCRILVIHMYTPAIIQQISTFRPIGEGAVSESDASQSLSGKLQQVNKKLGCGEHSQIQGNLSRSHVPSFPSSCVPCRVDYEPQLTPKSLSFFLSDEGFVSAFSRYILGCPFTSNVKYRYSKSGSFACRIIWTLTTPRFFGPSTYWSHD